MEDEVDCGLASMGNNCRHSLPNLEPVNKVNL